MAKVMVKKAGADKKLSKNFSESEFRCRCKRATCDAPAMDPELIAKLQELRDLWGHPLNITSGSRCATWNSLVGGAHMSQHLLGKAADVALDFPEQAPRLVALAEKVGFSGIGVAKTFIHLDIGPLRRWTY